MDEPKSKMVITCILFRNIETRRTHVQSRTSAVPSVTLSVTMYVQGRPLVNMAHNTAPFSSVTPKPRPQWALYSVRNTHVSCPRSSLYLEIASPVSPPSESYSNPPSSVINESLLPLVTIQWCPFLNLASTTLLENHITLAT